MPIIQNPIELVLFEGPKYWFSQNVDAITAINRHVSSKADGNYMLWWRDPDTFPQQKLINLPGGNRGRVQVVLTRSQTLSAGEIAVYAGKGKIRSRLLQHVKPITKHNGDVQRNPYWWLTEIFPGADIDRMIQNHLGFSFIPNTDSASKVYTENLSIGIYRPWFNMRITA